MIQQNLSWLAGDLRHVMRAIADANARDAQAGAAPIQVVDHELDRCADGCRSPRARKAPGARILFLRSPEWRAAREECLARLGRLCTECGSADRINVDHILPRSKFPNLALEQSNLRPLCWPCNKRKNTKILPGTLIDQA